MTRFRLITEGPTDQAVLENILFGCCGADSEVEPLQPLRNETHKGQKESFGGWEAVLEYCASSKFEEAFQFTDFVVVHIDTDRCEDANFDVPRFEEDSTFDPAGLIARVARKLQDTIGPEIWTAYQDRIICAIAVDSIECWLLPIYARPPHNTKYLNCLEPLNHELRKQNFGVNLHAKRFKDYQQVSKPYLRTRTLQQRYQQNDGLQIFVENLRQRGVAFF